MGKMQKKIEVPNGIYTVNVPIGRMGARHFAILTKASPGKMDKDGEGNPIMSPGDRDKMTDAFGEWAVQVLPQIVVDGPYTYEGMPGEDQYAIFMALISDTNIGEELFRIVDE